MKLQAGTRELMEDGGVDVKVGKSNSVTAMVIYVPDGPQANYLSVRAASRAVTLGVRRGP